MARTKSDKDTRIEREAPTASGIEFSEEDSNVFSDAVSAGHKLDPRARKIFIMVVVMIVVYVIGLLIPKDMLNEALHNSGTARGYSFSWFIDDLMTNVNGLIAVFTGNDTGVVKFSSTMLRYVVIVLSGAGLAITGAVYQGSFKNALVSPSTLGVMSGSSLGMMIWLMFCVNDDGSNVSWIANVTDSGVAADTSSLDVFEYLWSTYSLAIFQFVGCSLVVLLVLLVMRLSGKNNTSGLMIIITGQVLGGLLGAFTNTVRYYYMTADTYGVKAELMQSLGIQTFYRTYSWIDVVAVAIPLVICFIVIMRLRNRMIALQLDKQEARAIGVDTKRMQFAVVGVCTLLTAILIAFCGTVGFVGFLIPHLSRRLVGPNFKYLIPAAAVLGGLFVLVAYVLVSATLGPDYETMTGMFISILGSGIFLVTALRGKGVRGRGF